MTTPLWTPDAHRRSTSQVEDFRVAVGVEGGYWDLHRWSVEYPDDFWRAAWDQLGVVGDPGDRPIQVDSHYHFLETNAALVFDRGLAYGRRLNVPSGSSVRFVNGTIAIVRVADTLP